ncbi:MAG: D-alanyl-D-alanine carboxypeptidase, partial [Actinomycetota bacterium]
NRSTLVPVIGTVTSAPLSDVVAEMLVTSDNNTAELLVKELGVMVRGEGSRAAGLGVIRDWLTGNGITTLGVELADGSGLSNDNLLTCELVLAVLQRADAATLLSALPIAASTGTLADEFTDSPLADRLRGKTGTLNVGEVDPPAVK